MAGCHIKVDDETLGTVTNVLELLPFYLARYHRQRGMFAFQGLHPAQFVGAHDPFTLLGQFRCLAIQGVDVFYLLIEVFIKDLVQPIAHLVRFEIGIFLKASPRVGARFGPGCRVS